MLLKQRAMSIWIILLLIMSLISFPLVQRSEASDTLLERYIAGDLASINIYDDRWAAQTFTVGNTGQNITHMITSVKLKLGKVGLPGVITVSIRAVDATWKPIGLDLTSGTTNGNTLVGFEWREITLTPYELSKDTTYAIVVRCVGPDIANRTVWRHDVTGSYTGGASASSNNNGVLWFTDFAIDRMFEEYGILIFAPEITNESPTNGSTEIDLQPVVCVDVTQPLGENFTITWYDYIDDSWEIFDALGENLSEYYWKESTINSSWVDESLTNYPLWFWNQSNDFRSITNGGRLNENGSDIQFFNAANATEYAYELEYYDPVTGTIGAWVNISHISASADTRFYIRYGDGSYGNDDPEAVWDEYYVAVYHCNDSYEFLDSTLYNNHGTRYGSPTNATGYYGNGIAFTSVSSDYYRVPHDISLDFGKNPFTLEAWFATPALTNRRYLVYKYDSPTGYYAFMADSANAYSMKVAFVDSDPIQVQMLHTDNIGIDDSGWHSWYAQRSGTKGTSFLDVDFNISTQSNVQFTHTVNTTTDLCIGATHLPSDFFDGTLDEIRLSRGIARNDSWMNFTYNWTELGLYYSMLGTEHHVIIGGLTNGTYCANFTNATECCTTYYWRVVTEDTSGNFTNATYHFTTNCPQPPTGVAGELLINNTLNISWTKGTDTNFTHIVRKADSRPLTTTDGTVIYNSTGTYMIESDFTENWYYGLWGYNNECYSTVVYLEFGALVINCYDEDTNGSLYFDAFISNEDGTQTYESLNNTNPLIINVEDDLPLGDKVSIHISAAANYSEKTESFTNFTYVENRTITYVVLLQVPESKRTTNVTCRNNTGPTNSYPAFTLNDDVITILGNAADEFDEIIVDYIHEEYSPRTYYRDLTPDHVYILNAYLPRADDKILCGITIVDEISQAVDDAYIEIKRNIGGVWMTIASRYTDGNGHMNVFLVDSVLYKFVISKTGYVTEYADWTPTAYPGNTIIFKIYFEEEEPHPPLIEPEEIIFTGYIDIVGGVLYLNYTDNIIETINTTICIYEINLITGNETLYYIDIRTGDSDFQISTAINTSNTYKVILLYNHTTFGFQSRTLIFSGLYVTPTTPTELETLLNAIIGPHPLGWSNFLIWLFLVAGCYYADEKDAGKILILLGGLFLFINIFVGFNTTLITIAGGAIPTLFIVVGVMTMWNDSRKRVTF